MKRKVSEITKNDLYEKNVQRGERVLLKTTNSDIVTDPIFHTDYVYLTEESAEYLAQRQAKLVGIDYFGIEKKSNPGHPTHSILLENNIVVVEGLYLKEVPEGEYELYCLPLKLVGSDGAPARVILVSI